MFFYAGLFLDYLFFCPSQNSFLNMHFLSLSISLSLCCISRHVSVSFSVALYLYMFVSLYLCRSLPLLPFLFASLTLCLLPLSPTSLSHTHTQSPATCEFTQSSALYIHGDRHRADGQGGLQRLLRYPLQLQILRNRLPGSHSLRHMYVCLSIFTKPF